MAISGLLALIAASLFTGAAIYILVAEQPARLMLDDRAMLAQWKPAYARGYAMQASLAVVSGVLGIAAWWSGGGVLWLCGSVAMIANWPWTLIVMMPVNRSLEGTESEDASEQTRRLMRRWAKLHAVRALLGVAGVGLFLAAIFEA